MVDLRVAQWLAADRATATLLHQQLTPTFYSEPIAGYMPMPRPGLRLLPLPLVFLVISPDLLLSQCPTLMATVESEPDSRWSADGADGPSGFLVDLRKRMPIACGHERERIGAVPPGVAPGAHISRIHRPLAVGSRAVRLAHVGPLPGIVRAPGRPASRRGGPISFLKNSRKRPPPRLNQRRDEGRFLIVPRNLSGAD